ncbi:MAG: phenylacetate--CoA ligase family protein [Candidatus Delongbacteria bacterium]|nr:phenylacetate--CoA ligase family protein [Candidatus Delongbacteria bacterium]MCG2760514.1 phenylacetate--CoA ligase family protein [Candidatus Delongbacteria bacterium]
MKKFNKLHATIADQCRFVMLMFRDVLLYAISTRYSTFISGFRMLSPKYMDWTSKIRAKRAYYHAIRKVPAYRSFIMDAKIEKWSDIPFTDKDSYVRQYTTEQRCVNGVLPPTRIMIDESSGSTGRPYNWVRSISERKDSHTFISYFASFCYGSDSWITINAFSMGAWATGLNMGIALQRNGVVKNTGPDISKILHTLEFFGKKHDYLITGYPPFLKQLMDVAEKKSFPLRDYKINALVGGEGMSEGLRDYLRNGYNKVFSGYGATDLEIGIAGETPLTVAIRRLARDNGEIREALFGNDSRLPMVFQYNPIMHYIEVNSNNELVFTVTRESLLSPRIRYNIHDEGGIARYDQMQDKLKRFNVDLNELTKGEQNKNLRLPLMWIYGRKDFTISVMGANIYPEDLEQCIFADKELSRITKSFCQSLSEGEHAEVRPAFYFEITIEPNEKLKKQFADSILQNLIELNADFREAWREYPDTLVPEIHLFREGEGPFKPDEGKIKQARIINK